jgi:hypothetical protein
VARGVWRSVCSTFHPIAFLAFACGIQPCAQPCRRLAETVERLVRISGSDNGHTPLDFLVTFRSGGCGSKSVRVCRIRICSVGGRTDAMPHAFVDSHDESGAGDGDSRLACLHLHFLSLGAVIVVFIVIVCLLLPRSYSWSRPAQSCVHTDVCPTDPTCTAMRCHLIPAPVQTCTAL